MKLENVTHIAKSNYAYNIDRHTLHIRLRTTKDTAHKVAIRFGDPFMWGLDEETNEYKWSSESAEDILLTKVRRLLGFLKFLNLPLSIFQ